jgi:putative MATE family efflux protein
MGALVPSRRSPHDRDIWRLALPAFGALAAEPLYVLVDTAIVGQLGTRPLAGLAVAGIVLTSLFAVFNFLAYSTTSAVARRLGAGDRREAAELGVDGMWLALGLGIAITLIGIACSSLIVDAMGASPQVRPFALTYLRISLLGAPAMLVMLAATGYFRGAQDTRTPLAIAVGSNVVNLVLELVFVFGLDAGIAGSAWGTVCAQVAGAAAFVVIIAPRVRAEGARVKPRRSGIRQTAVVGGPLIVRTASLLAVFLAATNIAARLGDDEVAAQHVHRELAVVLGGGEMTHVLGGDVHVGFERQQRGERLGHVHLA